MLEIKIEATNTKITLALPEMTNDRPTILKDVFWGTTLKNLFKVSLEELLEHWVGVNDIDLGPLPDNGLKSFLLYINCSEATVVKFDLTTETNVDDTENEDTDDEDPEDSEDSDKADEAATEGSHEPHEGYVTVLLSGGLQSVRVKIEEGTTALKDVIYSDEVARRSGLTATQISSCIITMNDVEVDMDELDTNNVRIGSVIVLSVRASHSKG